MKSRTLTCITATTLFAALAMPIGMAAQDNPSPDHKSKHHQYKLIDLGTFGGPNSYISTYPLDRLLTNSGTVVGFADTPMLEPFDPNVNPDAYASVSFSWKKGVLTNLGALPEGFSSYATASNDSGAIIGSSENGRIDPLTGYPEYDAVLWKGGQIINLGTFGGNVSFASAINNRGQIAGAALNTTPDPFAFDFTFDFLATPGATQSHAALWKMGRIQDLGTLGGPDSVAWFINESGQIAGLSYTDSTVNPTTGRPTIHPFLWENGRMKDLGTLGGAFGLAFSLNTRGQVVGFMNLAGDLTHHAFQWDRGSVKDLGTLGGDNSRAYFTNDAGEVVGTADVPGSLTHHAFLWKNHAMTDLGIVAPWTCSTALDINSVGQVIGDTGICGVGGGPGFLWEKSGPMVDLNTLVVPGSGVTVGDVGSINDRGEIAAYGVLPNGDQHAVLLVPDGDCDDDCEGRIAASQNNAALMQYAGTMKQDSELPASRVDRLRNRFGRGYHLPGQPPAPRD